MSGSVNDMMAEIVAGQFQAVEDQSAAHAEMMQQANAQTNAIKDQIMGSFLNKKKSKDLASQLNPQALKLALIMTQYPRLLQSVQTFVDGKMAELEQAMDEVFGPEQKPQPENTESS